MRHYILRRVGYSLLSMFLLSLVIFLFVRLTGDPVRLVVDPGASAEDIENMRRQCGLDQPLWVQYWHFMVSLATGDLGQSFYYRTPVLELYFQRLPNSLLLASVAMILSLLIGIPSGILAAVRVDGFWDSAGKIFALLGLSLPSFWVGLVLILFFSVYLGWLPSSGSGTGRLLYEGIPFRDSPIVQGGVVMGGAMIVLVNLFVDILYALIDPRIRLES